MFFFLCPELAKVTTGPVSRRMRNAYSTLDALNFRMGQALRRRPAARLALFIYVSELKFHNYSDIKLNLNIFVQLF